MTLLPRSLHFLTFVLSTQERGVESRYGRQKNSPMNSLQHLNVNMSPNILSTLFFVVMDFLDSPEGQVFQVDSAAAAQRMDVETVVSISSESDSKAHDITDTSSLSSSVNEKTATSSFDSTGSRSSQLGDNNHEDVTAFYRRPNSMLKELFEERMGRQKKDL